MPKLTNIPSLRSLFLLPLIVQALFVFSVSADPLKIYFCFDGTFDIPVTDFATLKRSDFNGSNIQTVRTAHSDFIRGCQYDSTVDKVFLTDLDTSDANYKIYRVNPDNSTPIVLQAPIPFENPYNILGGFAVDSAASKFYFPDNTNWLIKFASSVNPLVITPPAQNVPEILETTPGFGVSSPNDLEIDPIDRKLYVANGSGGITRINLDGTGSERIVSGPGVIGLAVDPIHNQLFYTLENSQVWTAQLDGTNPIELTDVIGPMSDSSHSRMDIDYDIDTDKIYWVEYADPHPPFGLPPTPGKLRSANTDGTGAVDVISDLGYRAIYLTFQYGTLKPRLQDPRTSQSYVTSFPLSYDLGEAPSAGTVKVDLKQGSTTVASMTMLDAQAVTAIIRPFSSNVNENGLVTNATGFPIVGGTYTVELSYQDAAGHPAASTAVTGVTLSLPTPTPTSTPTATNTPTVTSTPTTIPTTTVTATPTVASSPTSTGGGNNSTPTATPQATPTVSTNSECTSSTKLPGLKIKGKKATITISAKKGRKYKFFAKPVGNPKRKAISGSVAATKNGKLSFSFAGLKAGLWEFSYSEKIKKVVSQSCPISKTLS